ncbi:hypothetical protein I553_3974 [Mycobacterium xenopi 4042]|uniref:Uncharacterized protein n=1 Tax=Mycobacterium xenopi 4042 TaxID=1299334 RepID=X7Z0V5_MYCXE|nr:hypothetical protein I553_3974 [Mycobacterium xenopi 4042]
MVINSRSSVIAVVPVPSGNSPSPGHRPRIDSRLNSFDDNASASIP